MYNVAIPAIMMSLSLLLWRHYPRYTHTHTHIYIYIYIYEWMGGCMHNYCICIIFLLYCLYCINFIYIYKNCVYVFQPKPGGGAPATTCPVLHRTPDTKSAPATAVTTSSSLATIAGTVSSLFSSKKTEKQSEVPFSSLFFPSHPFPLLFSSPYPHLLIF